MSETVVAIEYPSQSQSSERPRIWLPVTVMVAYWAYTIISDFVEMPMFPRFMSQMGAGVVAGLIVLIWWLSSRRVRWADKLIVLGAVFAAPMVAKAVSDESVGPFPIMIGIPLAFTGWVLWMVLARKARHGIWLGGLIVFIFLAT